MIKHAFTAVAALLATSAFVAPAQAAVMTYTLSGQFAGTINGQAFDTNAVFTGIGDTNSIVNGGYYSAIRLSSLTAIAGGVTYTLLGTFNLFNNPGANVAGFQFSTNSDFLDFQSPAFANWTPSKTLSATGVTQFALTSFNTDKGSVSLSRMSNATFSAAAGAVPEPATWGMMIVGFAAVGAAMRRKISAAKIIFA
jgi:hypothetical protein